MIDFDDPWLELLVNHDVHTQDLEARRVLQIIRLARAVGMRQSWLHGNDCLNANVLNLIHHVLSVKVWLVLLDVVEHSREGPLCSTIIIYVRVFDEVRTVFVDCIVCQVHV